jgi:hypothetical protein
MVELGLRQPLLDALKLIFKEKSLLGLQSKIPYFNTLYFYSSYYNSYFYF